MFLVITCTGNIMHLINPNLFCEIVLAHQLIINNKKTIKQLIQFYLSLTFYYTILAVTVICNLYTAHGILVIIYMHLS